MTDSIAAMTIGAAQALNDRCHCVDVPAAAPQVPAQLVAREPVFVSARDVAAIRAFVADFETVAGDPRYVAEALRRAPAIARHAFGPRGLFTTFDFHLTADGPRLIEINTNGGGAMLAAAATRGFDDDALFDPFEREWAAQRGSSPRGHLAIADEDPAKQGLFAEMLAMAERLRERGWSVSIEDVSRLRFDGTHLTGDHGRIDFVYNRLTDFYFAEHAALAAAYKAGAVVVSPHPRAHALYADKRNLIWLTEHHPSPLVPPTQPVDPSLWSRRKTLFFKPTAGFGSRAVYRGDKLTQRTWRAILDNAATYVAQERVDPSRRAVLVDGDERRLKLDLRAFTYTGQVLLLAARLYDGQTTNMRTTGGGIAPVIVV